MAEENIDIAKFNFNIDDVLRGATLLKKEIDALKKSQTALKKEGQTSTVQFVEQEAAIKGLNTEYQRHVKALVATGKQAQDTAIREQLLDNVLGQEVKTIKEAREQNKILNDLRNNTDLETQTDDLDLLNDQLDRNNALIKDNVDAYTQQKINIGNYKQDILDALSTQNLLANGTGGLKTAFQTAASGVTSFTKATLAFIATPIGAVIAALAAVFLLVKNALDRNEESVNKLKKAFAPLGGIVNALLGALEPLGEFLINGLVKYFGLVETAVYTLIDSLSTVLDFLGFESAAKSVQAFSDSIQNASEESKKLAEAEAELEKSQRKSRLTLLQYQKQAEEFRQIRDDESKSIAERIQANNELGAVLEQQLQDELAIAQAALLVTQLRIDAEGATSELLDRQAEALTEIADIEERITGQRSEQIVNRVGLEKEAEEKRQEAIDKSLEKQQQEIDLFVANSGIRAKTLAEELELEREISKQKEALLKEELKNKRISELEYATAIQEIKNEDAQKSAELLAENAFREVQSVIDKNIKIREQEGFLSEQLALDKIASQQAQFESEQAFALLQLEQGLINQTEFDLQIDELKEANRILQKEIADERAIVEKEEALELRALEFEETLALMEAENATRFEIENAMAEEQKAVQLQALEDDFANQLISQEVYEARKASIERKADAEEGKREEILAQQKIQAISASLDVVAGLVDKNSTAGKAIALAQAGINTFQGISAGVKLGYPAAIPAVALAALTGAKAIQNILKTKVPSATGKGNVSGGGSAPNVSSGVGGVNLGGKGVNLTSIAASGSSAVQQQLDNTTGRNASQGIQDAVMAGAKEGTEMGANDGITNLSSNKSIQNQSSF
tara:strand:+ start:10333 stop:12903 length:2571 start_codon:yes stop_codon:yes gene_type:complete